MAERSYEYTEIKTRIIIRNDSAENWAGSEVILEKGEPAIEYDAVNKTAKIKFGDGISTFSELPFSTLTPSEVSSLISAVESGESSKVTTVTTTGDGNAVTGGGISDDGTTLTLTKDKKFLSYTGSELPDYLISSNTTTYTTTNHAGTHTNNRYHVNMLGMKYDSGESHDYGTDVPSTTTFNNKSTFNYYPLTVETPTEDQHAATKKYVDDSVSSIVSTADAMTFKGTVGTSGTVANIASISSPSDGDTYKIITETTLTSEQSFDGVVHDLTVGDLVVYASNKWVFVPSGNEDVTTVKVAGSGDTINVSTTAQTGALVLGTAAGVNTVSTVTDSATTVPTSSAVKTYVDTLENSLGTAAITDATAYATAAQGTLADNAMPKSGGTFTGAITLPGAPTADLQAATKKYVDDSVSSISTDSLIDGENILILNGGSATE